MLLSVVMTLSIYPFIATADALARINFASGSGGFTVLPPLQSYLMHLSIKIVGGIGLYTFFQIFLFYTAIAITYRNLLNDFPSPLVFFVSLLTITLPIFLVFPAILTDSSLVFSCIAFISAMISSIEPLKLNKNTCFFAFTILLCILFGMRLNSIILAPAIIVLVFLYAKTFKWHALLGIVISTAFVFTINNDLRNNSKPEALGMAWEIVAIAKKEKTDDWLNHSLDFCGSTQTAIERYSDRYLNSVFWDAGPPLPVWCITSIEGSAKVKEAYFSIIKSRPLDWAVMKLSFWARVYGLTAPLENIRRGVHDVDEKTMEWGGRVHSQQTTMRENFFNSADQLGGIVYKPYLSVTLSLILLILISDKKIFSRFFCLWALSNAYYAGFLISAQSMEFRYFAPTFYINLMIIVSLLIFAIAKTLHFMQRKLEPSV